ncbi:8-amino-7-oxononanoate synthase [Moorella sp. Hama-1]|uniref:8-amino-7-oxononanoate synthase n=1 Tax=Moorella sp. Hama-1 TaxID=2138101 RepID=UPI000D64884E|nr:8-amino-7-oxononanoate synthase [Moorella sp. Hama-1]BCV22512.1 8-amino-7-oxononanoate synthase [Moorella sp. Hama-1]
MEFLKASLVALKERRLYRQITEYVPVDGGHVRIGQRTCILLASNNYLGLTHHSEVQQAAVKAVYAYGTGSGSSRLITGSHPLYQELEKEIAAFKGTEAAIVFNNGYMANIGTICALAGQGDTIFSDELNHASIIDGCRLSGARVEIYRHGDVQDLARKLEAVRQGRKLVVTDGVFSMDGDIAPLVPILTTAKEHGAMVMVDDAHGTGVLGEQGSGTAEYYGVKGQVDIQMGTLSKALASEGGYVAGSKELIAYLRNKARSFIFSTALAPATVGAALAALRVLKQQPQLVARLRHNAAYMRAGLEAAGLPVLPGITPIIPVMVVDAGLAMDFARRTAREGVIVAGIRPPAVPEWTSRLRITVSAAHSRQDLDMALQILVAVSRELGLGKGT